MAYHALSGDETVVPFVAEYLRYFLGAARVVAEDGSYTGHLHSQGIVPTMVGAAMYAEATGDRDLLALCDRFLRFTLEQCSAFGWVPDGIGWPTCETCALADVIHLAIRLSRCGTGDYWPVVERFARNQLLQNQFIDPDRALTGRDPEPGVAEIVCGSFASWAKPNDLLGGPDLEGCCTQGGVRGLHLVLGNAVLTEPDGCVTVQMHFSLETGEVSVRSALPHTGYLAVTMKRPGALRLRLPEGCAPSSVCLTRDGTPVTAEVESHYLRLVLLPAGAQVEMTYPLPERMEAVTVAGEQYEVTWKCNTVMALTPEGTGYPIYRGKPQSAPPESAWPYAVQADILPW
jgi:hypothetical protein